MQRITKFVLINLFSNNFYLFFLQLPLPAVDQFGRQLQAKPIDTWEPRVGVASCLFHMAPLVGDYIEDLFKFYVPTALNDRNVDVRSEMLRAATAAADIHGKVESHFNQWLIEDFRFFFL
jgi:hypothetical protein